MSLPAGTTFGSFRIVAAIGAGGMGEVYRAHDSELGRDVALKVLSGHLTSDRDALARFEREAKLLASLNHPNIASIFGVARGATEKALVLELVPGATLADLIASGPLPIDRSLRIASQIADALDAAHGASVIHRDLKPANIKLTDDGTVKVLDFGLAKVLADDGDSVTVQIDPTARGMVLGTRSYMSPEQARGLPVDRRTDVWAFACVLYEMLTGRRAFGGASGSNITIATLELDPDWSALPATTPPAIHRLLRRAFVKDPRKRLRDIGDAKSDIEDGIHELSNPAAVAVRTATTSRWWLHGLWLMATVAALAIGFTARDPRALPADPVVTHITMPLPALGDSLVSAGVAISEDGRTLAVTTANGIWLRDLNEVEPRLLRGTAGATTPVFSPDGQSLAFFSDNHLKRMPVAGGEPMVVGDVRSTQRGFNWAADGSIYFGHTNGPISKLLASGGTPQVVTKLDADSSETSHRWPHTIANTDVLLYAAGPSITANEWNTSHVVAQSLKTGKRAIVVPRGSMPSFSGGYLFYMTGRSLQAQRFDPDRLEVNGPVMTVVADVARVGSGGAWFAISGNGTLAALREDVPGASRLIWLDRHGATSELNLPPAIYNNFRLSPDASRVAVTVSAPDSDVWTFDVTHGTSTRVTNDGKSLWPIWSADGSRILYTSTRGGPALLRSRRSNGSGDDDPVISTSLISRGNEWSASGLLTYMLVDASSDLWTTMPGGTPTVYAASDGDDGNARISPDGKWLAFRSTRTGRPAIYVDRFPAPTGEPIQVPGDGGSGPVWSHDGRELFFINGNRIWGAARQPAGTFSETRTIVDVPLPLADVEFDLAPDGRFLLAVRDRAAPRRSELLLTLNADADLRRRAAK